MRWLDRRERRVRSKDSVRLGFEHRFESRFQGNEGTGQHYPQSSKGQSVLITGLVKSATVQVWQGSYGLFARELEQPGERTGRTRRRKSSGHRSQCWGRSSTGGCSPCMRSFLQLTSKCPQASRSTIMQEKPYCAARSLTATSSSSTHQAACSRSCHRPSSVRIG